MYCDGYERCEVDDVSRSQRPGLDSVQESSIIEFIVFLPVSESVCTKSTDLSNVSQYNDE